MTLRLIRSRARELHAKTRKKLLGTLAGPLFVVLFYAFERREYPPLQQVLQPLSAFALAWSLVGLYFLNRGMWSAVMPGDAGLSTGLEFCRRELERQRDEAAHETEEAMTDPDPPPASLRHLVEANAFLDRPVEVVVLGSAPAHGRLDEGLAVG